MAGGLADSNRGAVPPERPGRLTRCGQVNPGSVRASQERHVSGQEVPIVIVGAGFGGLAMAIRLLATGRSDFLILEKAAGLGGSGIARSGAWMFLIGLPLGALLVSLAQGGIAASFASTPVLVIAGLLVGIGTRLGSGCTSGHGVCGISRFSARSIVATLTFMAAGIATVATMNALGLEVLP